ncbi:MAG: serine/threonine protein kinase, partial [Myxococcaceae bacterium]|nr:serine/threonine protein kinase [Myxococcaceae bacterium]
MPSALFAGPYELLNRLSAGGMGEIFVAKRTGQGAFEKHVALKLLLPHLVSDTEFIERFFDEARLVARMNHPNIVQLFDVGEADGRPFLAMALIEGLSLSSLIKAARAKKEQLPVPVVRLIAVSLLDALSYAHGLVGPKGEKLDVIHRDVTPSNVLISTAGAVLLTDFGIARASTNVYRTQPGRVRGKFAYMAPEHAAEGKLDQRADLFSAAVTLYEALTLVSPFARQGDIATMEAVVNGEVAHPRTLRGDAPAGLSDALVQALAKAPGDRFPSARAMRAAVMDGPVASAPELAELFTRLCGDEL